MSVEAFSWALKQQAVTDPAARAVLFGLANHANHEGRHAFPSVDLVCRYTGLSPRTVKAKLRLLQEKGLIRKGNQKIAAAVIDRADRRPVVYDLVLTMGLEEEVIGDEQTPFDESQQGATDAPRERKRGAGDSPRGGNGVQLTTERGARAAPETSLTETPTHTQSASEPFDYSGLADDGQPLTGGARQFPMTLDWQPNPEQFAAACLRAGLRSDTQPPAAQLANFTAHHADSGRRYGAMAWTQKLVDWIRRDLNQSHPKPTGGAHANGRQRTPARRLTAAEARERDRKQREHPAGGQCFDGEWRPGH